MNKSPPMLVKPEQKLNSEQKADDMHVSPAIAKPPVQATPSVSRPL